MKVARLQFTGLALLALGLSTSAEAGSGSIAGTIKIVSPLVTTLKLPVVGVLGDVSYRSAILDLPGLSNIKLPLIGSLQNLPVVSEISVSQVFGLAEAVVPLQYPLPALGSVNSALPPLITAVTSVTSKLP